MKENKERLKKSLRYYKRMLKTAKRESKREKKEIKEGKNFCQRTPKSCEYTVDTIKSRIVDTKVALKANKKNDQEVVNDFLRNDMFY